MMRYVSFEQGGRQRKYTHYILAFFWFSGLVCGALLFLTAGTSVTSLMRRCVLQPVSIVSLLYVTILPFLVSILMALISRPMLILPICFGKAFLFSFVSAGILSVYGSSGWIIQALLLSIDCWSAFLIYLWWLRMLQCAERWKWEGLFLTAMAILADSVYFRIISPFLACLIDL